MVILLKKSVRKNAHDLENLMSRLLSARIMNDKMFLLGKRSRLRERIYEVEISKLRIKRGKVTLKMMFI